MKRLSVLLIGIVLFAASCGSSSSSPSTTPVKPTFTATLLPANETSAIVGGEGGGSGTVTITFDVTKDAAGNVTSGTATFVVNTAGFPAGMPINAAHIHQGAAGVSAGVLFTTSLTAGEVVTAANGTAGFTKSGIAPSDPAILQAIMNNPAGYYFNIHSAMNPGGVARGQLTRTQ